VAAVCRDDTFLRNVGSHGATSQKTAFFLHADLSVFRLNVYLKLLAINMFKRTNIHPNPVTRQLRVELVDKNII
jgi:hypothetical protein